MWDRTATVTDPSAIRVGVRVPATKPIRDIVVSVQRAEDAGFDYAGFPDSHLNYREVWTTLGVVAASTRRIGIGPNVTNLVTRHPTVTASAARAVAELAPDRLFLGIGAGDSALGFDSLHHTGVDATAEGIGVVRALLAGESVRYGTFQAALREAHETVPVYVAASGPRMLRMAGAVGDAVVVLMGSLEQKLERVADAARAAGRAAPPPVLVNTVCLITDDVAAATKLLKPICLRVAQLEGAEVFARAGVPIDVPDHLLGAEGDIGHAADYAVAASEIDHLVSDEAALWFTTTRTLVGTAHDVRERLGSLARLGLAGVTLSHLSGSELPDALIDSAGPLVAAWKQTAPVEHRGV
ncbi:MAG: LLM class flavin-dependent oxidoreductase [Acidimicrobiia bacterium]